jgi:hypothetical protein
MFRQVILTIPAVVLDEIVLNLETNFRGNVALCAAGRYERDGVLELFQHSTSYTANLDGQLGELREKGLSPIVKWYGSRAPNSREIKWSLDAFSRAGVPCAAVLGLVRKNSLVEANGWLKSGSDFFPVDAIRLPGPGMGNLAVNPLWPLTLKRNEAVNANDTGRQGEAPAGDEERNAKFSRQIGFFGEGDMGLGSEIQGRARDLKVCVVGAGRMGSKAALELAQCDVGSRGCLTVVDGDRVEAPNLVGGFPLPQAALGFPKAEAVARMALALGLETRIIPLVATVSDRRAAKAIMESDVIFCCVDRNAGRLGAAILAARCNRVVLDLAGGSVPTPGGLASVAGEVRLTVPGSPRCSACMDDYDWSSALGELSVGAEEERNERLTRKWSGDKFGSYGGVLNSVFGCGMLLFLRLLQGKQRESIWLHFDANGAVPEWRNRTGDSRLERCPLCSENGIRGLGDKEMEDGGKR